jgi:transcription antitermination factor NusG
MLETQLENHWYAVYCRHRHERAVSDWLAAKGFTTYVADYQTRVKWGRRLREARKNLLPGYAIVQTKMDSKSYLDILKTPSVAKLVGNPWPRLSWIPDDQIESLQLLLRSREKFQEVPYWRSGQPVEVVAGPLAGLRGSYCSKANRRDFVIVSIDLFQRSVAVEVEADYLQRLGPLEVPSQDEVRRLWGCEIEPVNSRAGSMPARSR